MFLVMNFTKKVMCHQQYQNSSLPNKLHIHLHRRKHMHKTEPTKDRKTIYFCILISTNTHNCIFDPQLLLWQVYMKFKALFHKWLHTVSKHPRVIPKNYLIHMIPLYNKMFNTMCALNTRRIIPTHFYNILNSEHI